MILRESLGKGIDTEQERRQIEYRPHLRYIPPVVYIEGESGEEVAYEVPSELSLASEVQVTDTWLELQHGKERLDGLIQECEDKLSGDVITTTDVRVIQALQSYKGPAGPYDQITFADYKKLKLKPNRTSYESVIVDAYERHHNELGGKLEVAILSVAYDLLDDVGDTLEFVVSSLMKDILAPNESPEAVRETELDKLNEWLRLDVRRQQLIQEYRDEATGSNASEKRLQRISKEYREVETRLQELSIYGPRGKIGRKIYDRAKKLNQVLDKWEWLTRSTAADLFDGYIVCMIRGLLAGIDTGFEIDGTIRRLKAIQAILECVHGDHKRTLSDVKGKLENLKKLPQRFTARAAEATLAIMKARATDAIRYWLQKTHADSECPAFLELGQKLIDAARALDIKFELLIDDEERMNRLEASHYDEFNAELLNKRKTSEVFRLLDELIRALEMIDEWGEQENLDEWIRKFVRDNHLDLRYNPETGMVERMNLGP